MWEERERGRSVLDSVFIYAKGGVERNGLEDDKVASGGGGGGVC